MSIKFEFAKINLAIVCPMADEETTAVSFVNAVLDECHTLGFNSFTFFAILDHQSSDKTRDILEELAQTLPELRAVWAPQNRSVVDAYVAGYREALSSVCDWILEIDAGFSHQPADIHQFFMTMARGYDCVFGSRFCRGGRMNESSP